MSMARLLAAADYAARMHRDQRRKGARDEPYINHPLDVARRIAASAEAPDETLLLAALLHDVVEDTDGTESDIATMFGAAVAALVMEVTDDKSLPKAERKRLQVEKVASKSENARRLKLADKASNVTAIAESPPDWPWQRKNEYLDWAETVVRGCAGVDAGLEADFAEALARARTAIGEEA